MVWLLKGNSTKNQHDKKQHDDRKQYPKKHIHPRLPYFGNNIGFWAFIMLLFWNVAF